MDEFDPKKAATDLVAAFVSNNSLDAEQLPALLASVYSAVTAFGAPVEEPPVAEQHVPKVSVRSSTRDPNFIVSLITGEKLKTLKRHLKRHGLTPVEYRERYGLPRDYPMVAPTYSDHRRAVAQRLGLGRKSPAPAPVAAPEAPTPEPVAASVPAAASVKPARPRRAAPPKKAAAPAAPKPAAIDAEKPKRSRKLGLAFAGKEAAAVTAPTPASADSTPPASAPKRRSPKPAAAKAEEAATTTPALPAKTPGRRSRNAK